MNTGEKITLDIIKEVVDLLNKNKVETFEFIQHNLLPDQVVLKQGRKVYYSPKIKKGEVKVLVVPEEDFYQELKITIP